MPLETARPPSGDLTFLATGGGTAALIAAHDWTATVLGPIETWPQSLRTALGLILHSPLPIVMLWGEDGIMLYNDAYAGFAGARHPRLLGSKVREGWPEVADFNDNVMRVGLAGGTLAYKDQELTLYRHGRAEQVWMNLDYSPVPDESGRPAGVIAIVVETTERVLAERRKAFLVELSDALSHLADPQAIMATAAERLGRHLAAGRAGYAEVEIEGHEAIVTIARDWCAAGVASAVGRYRLADYAIGFMADFMAGEVAIFADLAHDSRTAGAAAAAHAALGIRAQVVLPLVKAGRLSAILFVHAPAPRHWSDNDITLIRDVAERTWASAVRARAEAALRESEERLRLAQDAGNIGLWDWNVRTGQVTWSPSYYRIWGIDPSVPPSLDAFLAHLVPAEKASVQADIAAVLAQGDIWSAEMPRQAADGTTRWVAARGELRRDAAGAPERMIGVCYDITDRMRVEETLRTLNETLEQRVAERTRERNLLATIVETTDAIIEAVDKDFRWLAFNGAFADEFARLFGVRPRVGADMLAALEHMPAQQATVRTLWRRALAGEAFSDTAAFGDPAVDRRFYEMKFNTLRNAAGEIAGAFQVMTDVTVERAREARLVQAERRFRAILDTSFQAMGLCDIDGTVIVANRAGLATAGVAEADVIGRRLWETPWWDGAPDDSARLRAEIARVAAGETVRYETCLEQPDGSVRHFDFSMKPVLDHDGRPVQIVVEARDITADKENLAALQATEAARREADALYRAFFENTAEALFVIGVQADGGFVIEQLNPAHEAGTGLRMAAVGGRRIEKVLPPDLAAAFAANYRRAVATGSVQHYREVLDLTGTPEHWDTVLVQLRDAAGRVVRVIGSARNVTRQVIAEEALRQAQKMEAIGQLTGGIAHDFNNLLGAVVGSLDLIRRKPEQPERVRRFAEHGLAAAERGAKLTAQLLAFSRAQRLELKPLSVAELVAGMRDLIQRTLGPMIRVRFALDEAPMAVLSDATQLEMAVLNLAINARDAMPEGGELAIRTIPRQIAADPELAPGDYVELSVTDTGAGMPPEIMARAFDPFFTTKGIGKGTGLGLSQVYGLARQAGGAARIESRPGAGTTVRLFLRCTEAAIEAGAAAGADDTAPGPATATVLVVDDDPDLRRMLADMLDMLGYRVRVAESAAAGLAALAEAPPDLLLVDFAMPGMNGAEMARIVRDRLPALPILFASGYADTAAIEGAIGPEARLLRKPFRLEELHAMLAEALARTRVVAPSLERRQTGGDADSAGNGDRWN